MWLCPAAIVLLFFLFFLQLHGHKWWGKRGKDLAYLSREALPKLLLLLPLFTKRISSPPSPGRRLKPSSSTSGEACKWERRKVTVIYGQSHIVTDAQPNSTPWKVLHKNVDQISQLSWLKLLLTHRICSDHSIHTVYSVILNLSVTWYWSQQHSVYFMHKAAEALLG